MCILVAIRHAICVSFAPKLHDENHRCKSGTHRYPCHVQTYCTKPEKQDRIDVERHFEKLHLDQIASTLRPFRNSQKHSPEIYSSVHEVSEEHQVYIQLVSSKDSTCKQQLSLLRAISIESCLDESICHCCNKFDILISKHLENVDIIELSERVGR